MIDRRAEDRWISTPVRKASLAMSGVVVASLGIHAGLLLFAATFGERMPPAPPKETVVELVQEPVPAPKPPKVGKDQTKDFAKDLKTTIEPEPKGAETPKAELSQPAPPKTEQVRPEQAKPEQGKPDQAKPDQGKTEEPKAEEAKAEKTKPEPRQSPKPESIKPEPAKVAETKAADQGKDTKIAEKEAALQSLRQELDSLKAEQETLKAEAEATAAAERQTVDKATFAMGAGGMGAMPPSFGAMQLPQLSEIEGESTGYEQVVFSQLARAKGVRRHMGMAGTAGIVFTIDATGKLVNATIAHPSGSAALDDEAMQIVNAAAPFPKPPPGSPRTIAANFNFVPQAAP